MATIGDIVTVPWHTDGKRWVVVEHVGSPCGSPPYSRLIRKRSDGGTTAFLGTGTGLTIVESPTFAIGEAVKVDGNAGEVIATTETSIRVRLASRSRPLRGGGAVHVPETEADVPLWRLILENKS